MPSKPVPARSVLDEILARSDFSPTTRTQYTNVIGSWLEFAGNSPERWTRLRAQAFYEDLLTRVSVRTANTYIASLRYVSKWYSVQYDRPDFVIVQTREADRTTTRRALDQEEVGALLATCQGSEAIPLSRRPVDWRDQTLLIVGLETGMRRISLVGMHIENIDRRGDYPSVKVPIKGRGGRATFDVPLSDTALVAIDDWLKWLRAHGVKQGPLFVRLLRGLNPQGRTTYAPGGGITLAAVNKIIDGRARRAKIAHVHPHLLRNTFITWRLAMGLNGPQIASITGHKTLDSEWQGMAPYFDMKMIGGLAREATPPWFSNLVHDLVGVPRVVGTPVLTGSGAVLTESVAQPAPTLLKTSKPSRTKKLVIEHGEVQAISRTLRCPRCNAAPGSSCDGPVPLHRERILLAAQLRKDRP